MNRRSFFKTLAGLVVGILFMSKIEEKPKLKDKLAVKERHSQDNYWKFYINGEEIDGNRAVDEHGALHWPFQGSKKGDLCTAKSPEIYV